MKHMDFQKMAENGITTTCLNFDLYRTWSRTLATCQWCGKRRMDEPLLYGLADINDTSLWWATETDCGCRSRQVGVRAGVGRENAVEAPSEGSERQL